MDHNYLEPLCLSFEKLADPAYAKRMKQYMRNQFEFLGIPAPLRKKAGQEFLKTYGFPSNEKLEEITRELWQYDEREYQFFAMEVLSRLQNKTGETAIDLYEFMIENKSWWDTVDYTSGALVGQHFKRFPEQIIPYTEKWMNSGNMWLQRAALLFQLGYKKETDTSLLFAYILRLIHSKEFFIRKAIGWTLRQLSKTNPELVLDFVHQHESILPGLSKREALKVIERKKNQKG